MKLNNSYIIGIGIIAGAGIGILMGLLLSIKISIAIVIGVGVGLLLGSILMTLKIVINRKKEVKTKWIIKKK
jgi:hypothetical protein